MCIRDSIIGFSLRRLKNARITTCILHFHFSLANTHSTSEFLSKYFGNTFSTIRHFEKYYIINLSLRLKRANIGSYSDFGKDKKGKQDNALSRLLLCMEILFLS